MRCCDRCNPLQSITARCVRAFGLFVLTTACEKNQSKSHIRMKSTIFIYRDDKRTPLFDLAAAAPISWSQTIRLPSTVGAASATPSRRWLRWTRASPTLPEPLGSPIRLVSHGLPASRARREPHQGPPRLPLRAGHPGRWCRRVRFLL